MRRYVVSLLLLLSLIGTWQLATPLLAAPDEPQHVVKAAAVARGEWVGVGETVGPVTHVGLPEGFTELGGWPRCFAFRAKHPASCAPPVTAHGGPRVDATTTAGRYPPAYYGLVGLPTLVVRGVASDRYARVVSAVLCALLLAAAMAWAAGDLLALVVPLATTPMVLFLGAVVNPSGVEIAAATATWVGLLRLRTSSSPRLVTGVCATAAALALSRPVSPLWLALIVLTVAAVTPRARVAEILRDRRARVGAAAVAVCAVGQTAWVVVAQSTRLFGRPVHVSRATALGRTLAPVHVGRLALQLVGTFGWLDTPAPRTSVLLYAVAALVVLGLGLARGPRRLRVVLVAALVVAVVVPAVLEASSYPRIGFWWQGRYGLPLFVGLPFLALVAREVRARWLLPPLVLVAAAQVLAFVLTLARYTVGRGKGLGLGAVRWHPPLPPVVLVAVFAALVAAWVLWCCRLAGLRLLTARRAPATGR